MGEPAPVNSQAERTASLSRAAESLAKAATKLSEAARAMSLVAEALSKGSASKTLTINASGAKSPQPAQPDTVPSNEAAPAEDEGVGLPQPYRILFDDEADVLLVLCSLIYDRSKVVCYLPCGAHSLKLYKNLISGVTGSNVLTTDPFEGSTLDVVYDKFLKERRSIILLPETDIPSNSAKEAADYTVIHVGWPSNKRQYVAQRRAHHASTNLLLAYSGDQDLYPSGSAIMSQTEAWPGDSGGFRASVDILRPLFEEALSEVPFEMKEEAYLDWIHLHSKQGPRFVSSWTPSTLVNRANNFILGPLAYRSPASLTQESTPQAPLTERLPEVPMEFVAQHGLQAAVDEGLLRVEVEADDTHIHDLGSNSASRWSAEDTRTQGAHVPFNHTPQHEDVWEKYYSSIQKSYTTHSHGVNTLPAAVASVSLKALGIGDVLPSFTLLNQSGENVELGSLAKEKGVVIFVIPKANTPGCTTQACGFRDNYQYFTELGYVVYCLSHDSPKVQTSWQSKHTLPYPLLSDPKRTFINLLGAWVGGGTRRSHFVFEKGTGKLVERQIGVKPADSPKSALEFVKKHAEETRTWGTHVPLSHTPQYQNDSGIYNTNVQNFVPQFHGVGAPPTTSGNPMNFELATGNTYFALEEEFDSIPLIHFLTRRFNKTIIFLEGTMLEKYRNLFRSLMRQKVLMVKPGNFPKQAEEISLHFVQSSSPAVLLIEHTFSGLPDALKHQSIGCWLYCVHDLQWAYWVQDLKIQIAKIWQSQINYAMGAFIIPSSRKKSLAAAISGFPEHPQASLILSRNSPSLLESERNAVRSTLLSEGGTIRGLYSTRIASLREGSHQGARNPLESVRIANQYAARVLLHGSPEDGSNIFPPIAGRPCVSQDIVNAFRLQPAVDNGLLFVSSN